MGINVAAASFNGPSYSKRSQTGVIGELQSKQSLSPKNSVRVVRERASWREREILTVDPLISGADEKHLEGDDPENSDVHL